MTDKNTLAQNASKLWLVEYDHAGANWTLEGFYAVDAEDAAQKLRAIGATGRIVGPIAGSFKLMMPSPAICAALFLAGGIFGILMTSVF